MRTLRSVLVGTLAVLLGLGLLVSPPAQGQQILQQGFEARGPYWKPGGSDAKFQILKHELTDETAHQGQRSEHIRLQVERGTYIHYTFDVPKAPITDELHFILWLKSNRPGIQLFWNVKTGTAVIHASGLKQVAEGRTYCLWMIRDGTPVAVKLFNPDPDGHRLINGVELPKDRQGIAAFALTEEPAAGSPQPTMTPFLVGTVETPKP